MLRHTLPCVGVQRFHNVTISQLRFAVSYRSYRRVQGIIFLHHRIKSALHHTLTRILFEKYYFYLHSLAQLLDQIFRVEMRVGIICIETTVINNCLFSQITSVPHLLTGVFCTLLLLCDVILFTFVHFFFIMVKLRRTIIGRQL